MAARGFGPPRWSRPILLALAILAGAAAIASERLLDGGAGPPVAAVPGASPRSYADLGEAGIVLVSARGRLIAYVDRLADNGPVVGATVSAKIGDRALAFAERARGVYVAEGAPLKAGPNHIALSVASGLARGLVEMSLTMPAGWSSAAVESAEAGGYRVVTATVAILLVGLTAGGIVAFRSFRRLG
ncbi:MAG: hypothetical protein IT561_28700 [Alphaproteobacteria bacterium]|nr:hypothetical protein [Alphaproteobacteria bacterium]